MQQQRNLFWHQIQCLQRTPAGRQQSGFVHFCSVTLTKLSGKTSHALLMQVHLQGHLSSQLQPRGLPHPHRQPVLHLQQPLWMQLQTGGLPNLRLAARSVPDELRKIHLVIKPGQ